MIEKTRHWERYSALMDAVTANAWPERRKDGGYKAALYILAADDDLFRLASESSGAEGIQFGKIRAKLKKGCYSDSQMAAVKVAGNLFNGQSGSVTPLELAGCEWSTLDVICNAFYLWKGRDVLEGPDGTVLIKTAQREVFARNFETGYDLESLDDGPKFEPPAPSAHH